MYQPATQTGPQVAGPVSAAVSSSVKWRPSSCVTAGIRGGHACGHSGSAWMQQALGECRLLPRRLLLCPGKTLRPGKGDRSGPARRLREEGYLPKLLSSVTLRGLLAPAKA